MCWTPAIPRVMRHTCCITYLLPSLGSLALIFVVVSMTHGSQPRSRTASAMCTQSPDNPGQAGLAMDASQVCCGMCRRARQAPVWFAVRHRAGVRVWVLQAPGGVVCSCVLLVGRKSRSGRRRVRARRPQACRETAGLPLSMSSTCACGPSRVRLPGTMCAAGDPRQSHLRCTTPVLYTQRRQRPRQPRPPRSLPHPHPIPAAASSHPIAAFTLSHPFPAVA